MLHGVGQLSERTCSVADEEYSVVEGAWLAAMLLVLAEEASEDSFLVGG